MTCETVMMKKPVVAKMTDTLQDVLTILENKQIRALPVVDKDGKLVGMFGIPHILHSLLPVSARIEDGIRKLGFVMGAMPDIAEKLADILHESIETHMNTDTHVLHPDTATLECVRILVKYGSPIPVVERGTGKLVGLVTEQTIFSGIKAIMNEQKANA